MAEFAMLTPEKAVLTCRAWRRPGALLQLRAGAVSKNDENQHSMTKTGRHATTPGPWRAPNLSLMDRVWPCARWTTPSPCGKGLTAEAVVYVWRAAL
jgi:hypothetical protein